MPGVQIPIVISDIAAAMSAYDQIRVFRAATAKAGPYEEVTAAAVSAAYLLSLNAGPYAIGGLYLELSVDRGAVQRVTFRVGATLTAQEVVDAINAVFPMIASISSTKVLLTSPTTGTQSRIDIVATDDDAEALGWVAGDYDVGRDLRISLSSSYDAYWYNDIDGDLDYWYRYLLYNSSTVVSNTLSGVITPEPVSVLPSSSLSVGTVYLADVRGVPLGQRKLVVSPYFSSETVDGYSIGLSTKIVTFFTDRNGYAQISLVQGSTVRISIEGTSLSRIITVPNTSSFDILAALDTGTDPFSIASVEIPTAPRRSP